MDTVQDFQKYVCLVFDEVRVIKELVCDKVCLNFSNLKSTDYFGCTRDANSGCKAYMLVFMVRAIFTKLQFPYVHFHR